MGPSPTAFRNVRPEVDCGAKWASRFGECVVEISDINFFHVHVIYWFAWILPNRTLGLDHILTVRLKPTQLEKIRGVALRFQLELICAFEEKAVDSEIIPDLAAKLRLDDVEQRLESMNFLNFDFLSLTEK